MIKVYGVPGWGSTISELMLTLADIPYQFVDVSGFDHEGASRELLGAPNGSCFNGYWSGWLLMSIQHSLSPITLSVGHLTHLNS